MVLPSDTGEFDNSNCEPIHAPGSIQLHGILFVLQEPLLKIIQVSKNTVEVIGLHPEEILGKFFTELVGIEQIASIETALSEKIETTTPINL
jgi:chemotaxis family two-component system sensor kinase Cph1